MIFGGSESNSIHARPMARRSRFVTTSFDARFNFSYFIFSTADGAGGATA